MITIYFNKKTSKLWNSSKNGSEYNLYAIKHAIHYLNERYVCYGYLYTHEIFEELGIEWNPYWKNEVWIYFKKQFCTQYLDYKIYDRGDGFVIFIDEVILA